MDQINSLIATRGFDRDLMDLDGKSILITGGTGGFGRAMVELIVSRFKPARLAVLSRDELKQFEMAAAFAGRCDSLEFIIGDVRDESRVLEAMAGIDVVIHAAALKHVPIAERNPGECLKTNVDGALNIVRAARRLGTPHVCSISTDKAVNPVNVYGASKLAAEKIFSAAAMDGGDTVYCSVRYGNVVGSRGSVIPFFNRLVEEGATELPVTDARMTRFWITMDQAVNFTLSSLALAHGGEVFVPKIATLSMLDIAHLVAPDLEARIVGIRPGEKLHEVLISADEARTTLELSDRFALLSEDHVDSRLRHLAAGAHGVEDTFCYASDTNPELIRVPRTVAQPRRAAAG